MTSPNGFALVISLKTHGASRWTRPAQFATRRNRWSLAAMDRARGCLYRAQVSMTTSQVMSPADVNLRGLSGQALARSQAPKISSPH